MYNSIICRYHEIATKGNNRNMFERCLVENIRHLLDGKAPCRVHRVRGRVWVEPKHEGDFTPEEYLLLRNEGVLPVTLGPLVLRCATAAVSIIAITLAECRQRN